MKTKQCTGPCKQVKPINKFSKDKNRPDGYNNKCKECQKLYWQTYKSKKLAESEKCEEPEPTEPIEPDQMETVIDSPALNNFLTPNTQLRQGSVEPEKLDEPIEPPEPPDTTISFYLLLKFNGSNSTPEESWVFPVTTTPVPVPIKTSRWNRLKAKIMG